MTPVRSAAGRFGESVDDEIGGELRTVPAREVTRDLDLAGHRIRDGVVCAHRKRREANRNALPRRLGEAADRAKNDG